jgi:hypothetical protein
LLAVVLVEAQPMALVAVAVALVDIKQHLDLLFLLVQQLQ